MIAVTELHGEHVWRYLMESVTDGQGDLRKADAITRYYLDAGTPPGRWLGTGLGGLDRDRGLTPGSQVAGVQMERLFAHGRDPVTGDKLGRRFRKTPSYSDRVAARVRALPPGLATREREEAAERIQDTERGRKVRRAVAGFDYTFNPPKACPRCGRSPTRAPGSRSPPPTTTPSPTSSP